MKQEASEAMEMKFPLTTHDTEAAAVIVQDWEEHRLEMRRVLE